MSTTAPAPQPYGAEVVAEYGTELQLTRVLRTPDGGHLWWQGPGAQVEGPLLAPAAHLVPRPAAGSGAALLTVPERAGDGLLHRVAGPSSAAAWLRDFRPQARALVARALASTALALRTLHAVPLPPYAELPLGAPPGLGRLRSWAHGSGELRERTLACWGARRMERLLDWADALAPQAPSKDARSLIHGWASLGALVPPLSRGPVALLTGEDLAAGRPELDLGWLLGELVELAWTTPHQNPVDLQRVLLEAYGPGPDPVLVGRSAVLRVVTHMQDFATYRGWDDELLGYIAFTAELIDEEGRRAVPQGVS
ncbi:hypothetical protein OOK31_19150 [Streptomyces sp. NBC_00249]|uniref:hypothetical protein n=1 Tax=Streptomyces sp. NBC_00249 TaxID=2975690 RepID=UPI0022516E1B|nr:hypothetical protein [Streptomyces sp. NBC_00249]MCX5195984.1 hypothetical protein [Streptomyces sp. NBC_00249]